jgi:hypothetical protein
MASSLSSLAAELQLNIVKQLDPISDSFIPGPSNDLLSLSRVCKALRNLVLPFLFRNVTLLNEERSASSVLTILRSPYKEHARHLRYVGNMAMPDGIHDEDIHDPLPEHFPQAAQQVLSSLADLPNLERVTVQFIGAKTGEEDEQNNNYAFDLQEEYETDEEVLESEKTIAFRALMERSYRALSQNPPCTIKTLELKGVIAKKCSAWQLPEFQAVLQNLSAFAISLRGGDNGAGWQINKADSYLDFVAELHTHFFRYLSSVKHFRFAATNDGPPGMEDGISCTALPLHREHMPQLQSLELEYTFISADLAAFITAHSSTLETVRLNHCYSGWGNEAVICWGDFFGTIAAQRMSALKAFEVGASDLEKLEISEDKSDYYHNTATTSKELREKFSGRRMYDYKTLDDKYGMVFDSEETAWERFEQGGDHAGWEQLRRLIEKNVGDDI